MAPERTESITIRLTSSELGQLKKAAEAEERTISQIVRFAIKAWLEGRQ